MVSGSLTDRWYGFWISKAAGMLIVCPSCATTYHIGPAALGAGRNVRCAQCKDTWFAQPEPVLKVAAASASVAAGMADDFGETPAQDVLPPLPAAPDNPFAVIDAPPLVPHDMPDAEGMPKFNPGVPEKTEPVAATRARERHAERKDRPSLLRRLFSLPVLIVAMLALLLGALNWRAAMVRHFPQTASLYGAIGLPVNLRGLFFQDVKSRSEFENGVSVLVIEGTIVNLTTRTLDVPRLRFGLRNASGHEVYAWTAQATKPTLGSGNGLPFRARLASPPADGRDVIVRFLNPRDVAAGS
jgi:predicted Zn finger-like uncharacterized protein